ncbi:MAG: hypothetical protein ACU837_03040 [Gammaproteobacteria bacterium]
MGDIAELWIWMLGIALAAFAPLGFFIYRFSMKAGDPLGAHGEPHAPNSKVEAVVNNILGILLKKK